MTSSALFVTTVPVTLEVFLAPFARHFRARGWHIDALANGAAETHAIADAFDRRLDIGWSRNPLSPANVIGTASKVREVVREGGYDLVHVHTPIAAFMTRFALRGRTPGHPVVIYTAHGFHFYRGQAALPNAVYRFMERVAAPWTDYLVTINEEDFSAARELGIPADRVRLIPGIGVDVDAFTEKPDAPERRAALRRELDVSDDAFLLLMVAEFAPVKRHDHLLTALAAADRADVVLVLVGDGPLMDATRRRVDELGLTSRVRFTGYRRDIPDLLAASDALTLVSEREGLPRSVLEAMAASRPVIGTDTRGIADAIGDTGWVVAKNDAAALARAITEAASDRSATHDKGLRARERAAERFSLASIIAAYEELYREALTSRV